MKRKEFLLKAALLGTGILSIAQKPFPVYAKSTENQSGEIKPFIPTENVKIGFIGVGDRGSSLLKQMLRIENCSIVAVCDIIEARVERAQRWVQEKGFKKPKGYSKGEYDYRRMCEKEDLDLVIVATPWDWHGPMCIDAMKAGKHVATEVPGVEKIDECWELVELSEKTGLHCMCLENYCYSREIMTVYNLIRKGLFGDPIHAYAGYQKEYLAYNWNSDGTLSFSGKQIIGHWGNVYASHFAGPTAWWFDINRGDQYDYLVSMGAAGNSYNHYAKRFFGEDHEWATKKCDFADVSNTMIKTKKGRTITLLHDTRLPRVHRHYFRLQASNGIYENIEKRIHLQDYSPGGWSVPRGLPDPITGTREKMQYKKREWEKLSNYYEKYEHPLWKAKGEMAQSSGHGGSDYMMLYRIIKAMNRGEYPDIDVYDLAAWSSILELSDKSAANRSMSVDIPDFTRGQWQKRIPVPIVQP